jgi:hypothetical protein
MATDSFEIFLKLDGIEGESANAKYKHRRSRLC